MIETPKKRSRNDNVALSGRTTAAARDAPEVDEEEEYHRGGPAPLAADNSLDQDEEAYDDQEEGEPYFDPDEYEPVPPRLHRSQPSNDASMEGVSIPEPPPVNHIIAQDPSTLRPASDQEALQNALHAWYAAGYAAAVYHMRRGFQLPSS